MKKILLTLCIVLIYQIAFCQNFDELSKYEFTTEESYTTGEDKVLACVNYLFENPADQDKLSRVIGIQYILKWMEGTPNYTFSIGEEVMKLSNGNKDIFGLHLVAMTKVALENKESNLSEEELATKAKNLVIDYCSNPQNKMKPSKEIKKIIKRKKN